MPASRDVDRRAVAPWLDALRCRRSRAGRTGRRRCAPAAPTRWRCSRSRARRGLDVVAVYVDHGLRAGTAHDARVGARIAVDGGCRRTRSSRSRSTRRRTSRRARATRGTRRSNASPTRRARRGPRRAHARRPGRDRAAGDAARERRRPGWPGCRRVGAAFARPLLELRRARHARDLRAPAARAGARPDERRAAPPARVAAARGHPAARAGRAIAISSTCSPARPRCCATTTSCSTRSRPSTSPTTRPRWPRCRARSRAGSCGAGSAPPPPVVGDGRARARGRARRAPRGRAARAAAASSASRPRSHLRRRPAIGAGAAPVALAAAGPRPVRRRRRRGLDRARRRRSAWPDGRARAVCDADRVPARRRGRAAPRPGERFRPLGPGGSKLVRDALAEAGVPAGRRGAARSCAPVPTRRCRPTRRSGSSVTVSTTACGSRRAPAASSG